MGGTQMQQQVITRAAVAAGPAFAAWGGRFRIAGPVLLPTTR
jgi:hypothetical protein